MHADIEAVRIAELYVSHPLLRHMPIPRFRLPEIQLDVPVVIAQVDEPASGVSARGRGQPAAPPEKLRRGAR